MKFFHERTTVCETNTKYKLMFSGYCWSTGQIKNISECRILDAACGTGYGSYYLSERAKEVIGIDNSPKAIAFCRKKYNRKNLTFMQMNCIDLKFNDGYFDAVVTLDTIEHVSDDRRFLSEIRRVLKNNGICIISTPNSPKHNQKPDNTYHLREYSKDSLDGLISDYFRNVTYYGRKLSEELIKLENDLNKVRRYDLLDFRFLIPRRIRHLMADFIARVNRDRLLEEISINDIEYFAGTHESLTLIAICR